MTIESIEQASKTIVESAYEYETALQNKDKKKAEQTKAYILKICSNIKIKICSNIKKLIKEEKVK